MIISNGDYRRLNLFYRYLNDIRVSGFSHSGYLSEGQRHDRKARSNQYVSKPQRKLIIVYEN